MNCSQCVYRVRPQQNPIYDRKVFITFWKDDIGIILCSLCNHTPRNRSESSKTGSWVQRGLAQTAPNGSGWYHHFGPGVHQAPLQLRSEFAERLQLRPERSTLVPCTPVHRAPCNSPQKNPEQGEKPLGLRTLRGTALTKFLQLTVLWVSVLVPQSCLTLCNLMDGSPPGSFVHGILQARILDWVVFSFSRGSSLPSGETQVSRTAGRFSTIWATGKPQQCWRSLELGEAMQGTDTDSPTRLWMGTHTNDIPKT